jgi:hypothetical protein
MWFLAMHFMLNGKKGISGKQLERELGVTYQTAWRMLKLIREAMGNEENKEPFEATVEVDETYIGGKPRKVSDEEEEKRKRNSINIYITDLHHQEKFCVENTTQTDLFGSKLSNTTSGKPGHLAKELIQQCSQQGKHKQYREYFRLSGSMILTIFDFAEVAIYYIAVILCKTLYYPLDVLLRDVTHIRSLRTKSKVNANESSTTRYPHLDEYMIDQVYGGKYTKFRKCIQELLSSIGILSSEINRAIHEYLIDPMKKDGYFGPRAALNAAENLPTNQRKTMHPLFFTYPVLWKIWLRNPAIMRFHCSAVLWERGIGMPSYGNGRWMN